MPTRQVLHLLGRERVIKAALPWIGCLLLSLVAVTFVPAASTWLPNLMLTK